MKQTRGSHKNISDQNSTCTCLADNTSATEWKHSVSAKCETTKIIWRKFL